VETARAFCIMETDIMRTNNIYLTYNNMIYDILRSDIVDNGQSIYLLCNNGIQTVFQCQFNVFNPPLNTALCREPYVPSVVGIRKRYGSCPDPFHIYMVGFYFQGTFMELFQNCFDDHNLAFQHSIYMTYRHNSSALRPSPPWNKDGLSPHFDNAYRGSTTQACFVTNLGAKQPDCKFHRGHMTPSSAFFFTEHKKTTFRYLNAVPQYGESNIGNWKNIESWVNSLVEIDTKNPKKLTYDALKVCTGALGVHRLKHKTSKNLIPIYLLDNNKIPVPEWTYKIVSHLSGVKWVMLTYNDINRPDDRILQQICTTIHCHPDLVLNNNGNKFNKINGYTVCCEPFPFISKNIPHLTGIC
ncbi:hypothetical protein KR084_011864, partial [Drosophila pseudotakahashii]